MRCRADVDNMRGHADIHCVQSQLTDQAHDASVLAGKHVTCRGVRCRFGYARPSMTLPDVDLQSGLSPERQAPLPPEITLE